MAINKLFAGNVGNPLNSKGSDVANSVNALIDTTTGIEPVEAITLKGLPQTAGAPVGYGDLGKSLASLTVTPEQFGAISYPTKTAGIDSSDQINAALASIEINGGVLSGSPNRFYFVSKPIVVKNKASIQGLKVYCNSTFVGDAVFIFGEVDSPLKSDATICDIYVDANGENINVYDIISIQRVKFSGIKCDNAGGVLWRVRSGYELEGVNFNLSGNIPPMAASPQSSVGLLHETNDSSYSNVAISRVGIGFKVTGGGNRFVNTHAWSTFFTSATRMTACYHISGRTNVFTNCTADSPSKLVWANPNSFENGAFGYYVDGDGADVQLINCYLYLSNYGDSLPTSQSIIPVYADRSRVVIGNPKVVNDTGVADCVQPFFVASSVARLRESTIYGLSPGGAATMPENNYIANSFQQWVPDLKIGGASTGITYSNRRGMIKRSGSLLSFNVNINLTSKGALTGSLSFDLPVSNLNEYPDYKIVFAALIENQSGNVPVIGVLTNNSINVQLRNAETNVGISEAIITNTSRITVSGSFLTSTT